MPDPRCGQWLEYMEGHERWWDAIWAAAKANGNEEVTMTPEHGPPNYQGNFCQKSFDKIKK